MGGDLNLKKSWHPHLLKNQERVWAAEKSALAERKKTEQLLKERAEERALLELRQIQEAAGGKKVLDRVEFLYSGPSEGPGGRTEEEREAYLLGKRSVVGLLKGQDNEKLKKEGFEMGVAGGAAGAAVNAGDTAAKVREDPLLAIKRREQEALKALVTDPARRRRLQAAVGGEKEDMREKDRSSRRRHHRSRNRSPRRNRDRDRDRDERRDRSRKRGRDRSRSPLRRDRDERRYHQRSRSPRRDRDEKRADRNRSPRRDKEDRHSHRHHHRSRSLRKDRERSPPRRYDDRPRLRLPRATECW